MKRIALPFLLVGACAYGKVVKVPHPSSYGYTPGSKEWRDVLKASDGIEGARFYLPRPYVIVKQEFPVAEDTFIVDATIDDKGRVTISGKIPDRHARVFPDQEVSGAIHDPKGLTRPAAVRPQSESAGASTPPATVAKAGPETVGVAKDNYMTVDSVAPQHVDVANRNVDFKVTVLKDPVDEGAGGTLQEGVWVVPVVGGKPDVGKAVKAEFVRKSEGANGKHVFEAQLNAKQLPAFYSLGVVVTKTTDGKTTNFLFHRSSIDGTNPFAGGGKPEEPKKDAPEEPPKPLSSASISTMGNLTTSPYQKVSDLFDIALYPDFTEQYAARAAGNIGYAKADLAFENGWLAERVSMEMDNRELGLLIADTARKLVDVGIAAVSPAAAAADLVAQQPVVDRMRLQAEARRDKVQLRVDLIEYAVPGMHPLLKPEEYGSSDRSPRVEYQRRSRYVISLINLPPRPTDSPPAQAGLSQDDQSKLMEVVLGDGWKLVAEHAKVFKEDPQFTIKNDALAGASPLGVLPITYKKSAVKSGVSSEQRGAYFKELTDAVVKKTGVQTLKSIEATPE